MDNKEQIERTGHGTSKEEQEEEGSISPLSELERKAVSGLELGQRIYEKLEQVEASIEILARQKARELNQRKPTARKD
jgi:hypothetical protein